MDAGPASGLASSLLRAAQSFATAPFGAGRCKADVFFSYRTCPTDEDSYRHGWSPLLRQIIAKYAGKERQLSAKLQKRYGQPLDLAFLGAAGDETGRSAQNPRAASAAVVVTKTLRGPISRWAAGGAGRPDS